MASHLVTSPTRVRLAALAAVGVALVALTAGAQAQGARECRGYALQPQSRNICTAAVDATRALNPIAGLLFSGGNPVLGTAGTLGIWRGSVGFRTTAARVVLPATDYDGVGNTVGAADRLTLPMPVIEGALGVFNGLDGGFLSVDILGSIQPLPDVDRVEVTEAAARIGHVAFGLGAGVRVGLMADSGSSPGLSISLMRRDLPRVQYGNVGDGDDYSYAVNLAAWNVRAAISKRLAFFDFAAGVGWDRYFGTATAEIANTDGGFPEAPIEVKLSDQRWMLFWNAGLSVGPLRLVGEAGYQSGKDQDLTTDFEGFDTTKGTWFGALGLRVGL